MKIKRALPILWLPLIGFWTFLFAVQLNTTSTDLEGIVPLIAYLFTSFLLVLQLQLLIGTKREGVLVKLGTSYVLLICLLTSSISILLSIFQTIENQLAIILIVVPLIINTINAEVFSVSNKQIVKKKKALLVEPEKKKKVLLVEPEKVEEPVIEEVIVEKTPKELTTIEKVSKQLRN